MRLPTENDPVRVIHGDCLEVLDYLPDGQIGALVTDPPYGIAYVTNMCGPGGSGAATWRGDTIHGDENTDARDQILEWARGQEIPWACFGSWKIPKPPDIRGVLIWDKGGSCGMGDLSFPWKGSWEEIYIGGQGWEGYRDDGVLRGHTVPSSQTQGRVHPTEKPVSLLRALIKKLPPGCLIFEPFGGSGSTAVAALLENRRCLLVEKDEAYCDQIRERVRKTLESERDMIPTFRKVKNAETLLGSSNQWKVKGK